MSSSRHGRDAPGARGLALGILAVLAAALAVLGSVVLVRHEQSGPAAADAGAVTSPTYGRTARTTPPDPIRSAPSTASTHAPPTSAAPSHAALSTAASEATTGPVTTGLATTGLATTGLATTGLATTGPAVRTTAPAVPVAAGRPVVVLDPGHNGGNAAHVAQIDRLVPAGYGVDKPCNTTGTDTNAGYPEHAFTWDVAKRVRRLLEASGVTVRMTRHSDDGVGPCVNERAAIESGAGVAAAVAIHADGAPSSGHGFHICVDSRTPVGASSATVHRTSALDQALLSSLSQGSGLVTSTYIGEHGYYYRDDLAGLNLSTSPTSFLELGNMRNRHDAALQSSASGRQRIARAVAAGILAYLGR